MSSASFFLQDLTLSKVVVLILALSVFLKCVVLPVSDYFKDSLDLRKYPAPGHGIAGLTNFWCAYQVFRLRRFKVVDKEHKRLGPVIRIQPDHLSFNIPEAANDIYGHGSGLIKGDFYEVFKSNIGEENIVGVREKKEHSRKRKMISSGFAMTNVVRMQPVVDEALGDLVKELDKEATKVNQTRGTKLEQTNQSGTINLRTWMNFLTFDIIGLAGYGETMGFVKQRNDLASAQSVDGQHHYHTKAIETFHLVSVLESIIGLWPEYLPKTRNFLWWTKAQRSGAAFIDMCVDKLRRRIQRGPPEGYKDLFGHYLTDRNEKDLGLPFNELLTESNVILNAGSDTTATAMTNLLYLLMKDKRVLDKLRKELDGALQSRAIIPQYEDVKDLPYLRACVEEGLRMRPPLSLGLPRKTVAVTNIAGHLIQPGVTVSAPTWSIHHNETLFPDADTYKPERWLEDDTDNLKKFVFPFSQGPRSCIGRNLAYFEQLVIISTLVRRYDLSLAQPEFVLPAIDRHVANPGDCPTVVRFRSEGKEVES